MKLHLWDVHVGVCTYMLQRCVESLLCLYLCACFSPSLWFCVCASSMYAYMWHFNVLTCPRVSWFTCTWVFILSVCASTFVSPGCVIIGLGRGPCICVCCVTVLACPPDACVWQSCALCVCVYGSLLASVYSYSTHEHFRVSVQVRLCQSLTTTLQSVLSAANVELPNSPEW